MLHKFKFLFPVILFALVLALCLVQPVSADDGAPVDPAATETAPAETVDETAPTDEAAPAEGIEETAPAAGEVAAPVTRSSGNVEVEGDPVFKVGTSVYRFLPDDVTCPGGDFYCQNSPTPIQDALDYMEAHNLTPTDRKLHIEADVYNEPVFVDGTANGVKGLTGLAGEGDAPEEVVIEGSLTIHDMAAGFTVSNLTVNNGMNDSAAIVFSNNKGTVTLSDVDATAGGQNSTGIEIYQTGAVVLNRVNASNSGGIGAQIIASGPITITNSAFDNNLANVTDTSISYSGLLIDTNYTGTPSLAPVTLNGVSVSGNIGDGADIYADKSAVTVKNSVFNNNNVKDDGEGPYRVIERWGDGLYLFGNAVVLDNIQVNGNGLRGLYTDAYGTFSGNRVIAGNNMDNGIEINTCIDLDGLPTCDNLGAGTVTLKASASTGNWWTGFDINAKGAVTLYDVFSGFNGGTGITIDNMDGPAPAAITLTMVNARTNGNEVDLETKGIEIFTRGAITGTNVTANDNWNSGLYIVNLGTAATTFTVRGLDNNVGFNEANDNRGDGLTILSLGAVSLTSFDAYNNWDNGLTIDNSSAGTAQPVTIKVLDPLHTMNGYERNGGNGMYIHSRGAVTVANTFASNNQGYGALIVNVPPEGIPGVPVTVSDSYFENNWSCDEFGDCSVDLDQNGLEVQSKGIITATNISANGNDGTGMVLNNMIPGATGGVTIKASNNNRNQFNWNTNLGLVVNTKGAILVTNLEVKENNSTGALLVNAGAGTTAGVTLVTAGTGMSNGFFRNNGKGLEIHTNGPVVITNINANNNFNGEGLFIENSDGTGAVTIKQTAGGWGTNDGYFRGNTFNDNLNTGLYIKSKGVVTVDLYQARGNSGDGVSIEAPNSLGAVTVRGLLYDMGDNLASNGDDGLFILTKGNIIVTNISARFNNNYGASLVNMPGTLGTITMTEAYFDNNYYGLIAVTPGAVTWKNGSASDNFESGATILNNRPDLPAKPVTITNAYFSSNGATGLYIDTKGAVLLTNVEANNNSANYYFISDGEHWYDNLTDDQVWKFDALAGSTYSIEVSSDNFTPYIWVTDDEGNFIGDATGFEGDVLLTVADLPYDDTYFVHVANSDGWNGNSYEIKFYSGTEFLGTWYPQIDVANGMFIYNRDGVNAPVTLINSGSRWNGNNSGTNVLIYSVGAVAVTGMDVNDSGHDGMYIDNRPLLTGAPAVTLTNVNAYNNDVDAVVVNSNGAVTVKNSDVGDNGGYGYVIQSDEDVVTSKISLTNVSVRNSGDTGMYLHSYGPVTLVNTESRHNRSDGYDIFTHGAVTFTQVRAYQNDGYGATVTTPATFTILKSTSGPSSFSDNGKTGLNVEVGGKVTIANTRASNNGRWAYDEIGGNWYPDTEAHGMDINNINPATRPAVVLTDVMADNNTLDGTLIFTSGPVTVSRLNGNGNQHNGLMIDQTEAPSSLFPILLSGIVTGNNGGSGTYVVGKGNITVSKIDASSNGGDAGLWLQNDILGGTGSVTILNPAGGATTNWVNFNYNNGVSIFSNGAVSVTGLEVTGNNQDKSAMWQYGLGIESGGAPVTLNTIISRDNGNRGVIVLSDGVVTINNSWVAANRWDGIHVETPGKVFINNTTSINNNWAGMYLMLSNPLNLVLNNSTWFGNLRNPNPDDRNLMIVPYIF